jgi:hypothetical protein
MAASKAWSQKAYAFAGSGHSFKSKEEQLRRELGHLPVCLPASQRASVSFLELTPPPIFADLPSFATDMVFNCGRYIWIP